MRKCTTERYLEKHGIIPFEDTVYDESGNIVIIGTPMTACFPNTNNAKFVSEIMGLKITNCILWGLTTGVSLVSLMKSYGVI